MVIVLLAYMLLELFWLIKHPQQKTTDFCCLDILKTRDVLVRSYLLM